MFSLPSPFRAQRIYTITGVLLFCAGMPIPVFAQKTSFVDVPTGAYYEDAAAALLESGALDQTTTLRPAALATRAELVKLMVNLNSTTLLYPTVSSFNDVSRSAWYFPYFEAAANAGWLRGNANCYQQSRPCTASPASNVNRAEAASLLVRSFTLNSTGKAPVFSDNPQNQWYHTNMQTAADHCVLQGDDGTEKVRPAAFMNRAEMITMFYRASQNSLYGTDCSQQSAHITEVSPISSTRVRLTFNQSLSAARAEDAARYSVSHSITIASATLIDSKTVELSLSNALATGITYLVTASNLLAQDGTVFSDSANFGFSETFGHITEATAVSSRHLQLTFDTTLDTTRAIDASRYTVTAVSNGGSLDVQSVTILNSRMVDLTLSQTMTTGASYDIAAQNLLTQNGVLFTDSSRVKITVPAGHITGATATSTRRVRLVFDTDLDTLRAADISRYSMARISGVGAIEVQSVTILNRRTIDLLLDTDITANVTYLVTATHLLTQAGADFTESIDVTLSAALTGHVTTVTPVAANRIDVSFDVDLDPVHAEEISRYGLSDSTHALNIVSSQLLTNRMVELSLGEALQTQRPYTVEARGMQATNGVIFSDSAPFVYAAGTVNFHANLTGSQEVPSVSTTANGTGSFVLMDNGLHYDISIRSMSGSIVSAHIHQALLGANGPVVFTITFNGNRAIGVWSNLTTDQRSTLFEGGMYVNVHTSAHLDGEIRGQLLQ